MWKDSLREALGAYDAQGIVYEENGVLLPRLKGHVAVKEAVFPFNKLPGADLLLGPEMKSTGEVMGISDNFGLSFAKSQVACGNRLPMDGKVFMSLTDLDKSYAIEVGKRFEALGFTVVATEGTQKFFEANGVNAQRVLKISEGRPNIEDMLKNGEIAMAINTSDNKSSKDDAKKIRQTVLRFSVPYFTTLAAASASLDAITAMKQEGVMTAKALQDYLAE